MKIQENDIVVIHLAEGQQGISGLPTHQMNEKLGVLTVDMNTLELTFPKTGIIWKLNPKSKALYILFLLHPDGIKKENLVNHITDLKKLYRKTSNRENIEKQEFYIDKMFTSKHKANLSKAISRCNKQIRTIIPNKELQNSYTINILKQSNLMNVPVARYKDLIIINNQ